MRTLRVTHPAVQRWAGIIRPGLELDARQPLSLEQVYESFNCTGGEYEDKRIIFDNDQERQKFIRQFNY